MVGLQLAREEEVREEAAAREGWLQCAWCQEWLREDSVDLLETFQEAYDARGGSYRYSRAITFATKHSEMISTMWHGVRLALLILKQFLFSILDLAKLCLLILTPPKSQRSPLMVLNLKSCRIVDFDSSKEGSWCTDCYAKKPQLSPKYCFDFFF